MAYPGGWALLPVVSTALLIIAGTQAWINYYILSSQLLVWFGLISFPLYLWHWPLLAFARIVQADSLSLMMRLVIIILSVCLAWLTYLFIEQPLRYGKHAWRKALGLSLMLGLLGVIGGLIYTQPNLQNTRLARLVNPNIVNAIGDWAFPGGLIKREIQGVSFYANNLAAPQVLFVGDSHMDQYAPKVLALSKQHSQRSVAFVTEGGCPPIPHIYEAAHPYCPQLMERINIILQAYPSIRSIVVAGCWNCYFIEEIKSQPLPGAYQYYYRHNGQALAFRNAQGGQYALNALQVWMQQLANRYVVYLMLDNPSDARFNPNVMLGGSGGRWALTLDTQAYYQAYQPQAFFVQAEQIALNQRLMHLAYQAGAIPLNVLAEVCPQARCMPMDAQGRPLYSDQHHLRPFYVREHISVLDSVL
jgi:hypothetical protein